MNIHVFFRRFTAAACLCSAVTLCAFTLNNGSAQWAFSDHGSLQEVNGLKAASGWQLRLRAPGGQLETLSSITAAKPTVTTDNGKAVFQWNGLSSGLATLKATIRQTVVLRDDGATLWETTVDGLPADWQWDLASPLVSIPKTEAPAILAVPEQTGRLYQMPFELKPLVLRYPEQASMQFLAFNANRNGLLLYAQDPRWLTKKLTADTHDGTLDIAIAQTAADGKTAPVVLRPYTGDATVAARLYGEWATGHVKQSAMPSWLAGAPLFAVTNYEPSLALNQWHTIRQLIEMPFAAFYRNYTISNHNEFAPECFPTDPYFNSATHVAPYLDCALAPMIPSRRWIENRPDDAVQTADGLPLVTRNLNGLPVTTLCPATRAWQDKLLENARRFVVDHGCKAIVIEDILTADIECANEKHGHGKRIFPAVTIMAETLDRIKAELAADMPDTAIIVQGLHEGLVGHADAAVLTDAPTAEHTTPAALFQAAYGPRFVVAGTHFSFQDKTEQAISKLYQAIAADTRIMADDFMGDTDEPLPRLIRDAAQLQALINAMPDRRPVPCQLVTAEQTPDPALPRLLCGTPDSIRTVAYTDKDTLLFAIFNVSPIPQNLTLTIPETLLPKQATAMLFPKGTALDDASQASLTIKPNGVDTIRISTTPFKDSRQPVSPDQLMLFAGKDQYFPLNQAKTTQELWACDDSFVGRNPRGQFGMFLQLHDLRAIGIRKAQFNEELPSGEKAIGSPLPRLHDDQPFGLLHKLPHTLKARAIVFTLIGDESCVAVNGKIPRGSVFGTPKPGVFAARIITKDGDPKGNFKFFTSLQQFNEALAHESVESIASIAYAAFDDKTLSDAQKFAAAHHLDMTSFTAAWQDFAKHPDMARLATLSRESQALFKQANSCQQFFALGASGWKLLRQAQVCVKAATIFPDCMNSPCLAPNDDWLTPGIPKPILTFFINKTSQEELFNVTTLIPIGLKNPKAFSCTAITNPESKEYPGFNILLNDASANNSMCTLTAWTTVSIENEKLLAMDITWLTINQPLSPFILPSTPFITTKKTTDVPLGLLNNTSSKLEVAVAPVVPEGWSITAEPKIIALESCDFNKVSLLVKGPAKLHEGLTDITVNALLNNAPHATPQPTIPVDAITPIAFAGSKTTLDAPQTLTVKNIALYAIFAKKGERINVTIKNFNSNYVTWKIYNPDFEDVRNGNIKKEEYSKVSFTAIRDAAYLLKVMSTDPDGSVEVTSSTLALSLRASNAIPALIYNDAASQFAFFVPKGATHIICQASNQPNGATVTVTAPDTRLYTLSGDAPVRIPVSQDNADKPWLLSTQNANGTAIRLSGDAVPWLAPSPEAVLSLQ